MYRILKRIFDILFALLCILISSPFWLVAIIGIKVSAPGPIFYMANRVGKNDTVFKMYKFRSMRVGKANEAVFRGDEDRIFPFGAFIRSTKIDELPQLINILLGDMSVVGPRPAAVDQKSITRGGRFSALSNEAAGLTGTAAIYDYIYGDTVLDEEEYTKSVLPTRLSLDLYYINHMSFWLDIKLIWYTFVCIIYTLFKKQPSKILNELLAYAQQENISEQKEREVFV